ncbi:response regulator [Donghicola eburneus]|uniref:Response regulator receiver possibly associated with TMAO n=1 Tax=Donghicola eburneus TaxID=393278 RepID=A0A1M4N368_9RHOB|nr:response regulator [Donghicola eburneus]SCM67506.1 response regulator receiver possibly associated with TMAO [Donghicola eburneus]SFQ06108.1 Response regulator receiver domain-containing protein [Donghicola eburneus]
MTLSKTLGSILFVDDDEIETALFQRVCKRSPVVRCCKAINDPVEAFLHLLAADPLLYDVIFVDLNMPKINGIELLRLLEVEAAHKFSRANVIMLTSSVEEEDMRAAQKCGILSAFINKPLTESQLLELAKHYGMPRAETDCVSIS